MTQCADLIFCVRREIIVIHFVGGFCVSEQSGNIFLRQNLVQHGRCCSANPMNGAVSDPGFVKSVGCSIADDYSRGKKR